MEDQEIIKLLWEGSNLIAGFAAVQSMAFAYACAKKEFGDAINTRRAKQVIFWTKSAIAFGYCIAIVLCAMEQSSLDPDHDKVYWVAATGRCLFIFAITGFGLIALYARQLFSKESYRL